MATIPVHKMIHNSAASVNKINVHYFSCINNAIEGLQKLCQCEKEGLKIIQLSSPINPSIQYIQYEIVQFLPSSINIVILGSVI